MTDPSSPYARICCFIMELLITIKNRIPLIIRYPSRDSWECVEFSPSQGIKLKQDARESIISFDQEASLTTLDNWLHTISFIFQLLEKNRFSTKRDLFYQNPKIFNNQRRLDAIIDNLCAALSLDRLEVNVLSTCKGSAVGSLKTREADGSGKDFSVQPREIPSNVHEIESFETNAELVLVIEKDATFLALLDADIFKWLPPCIMVTAKGYPDYASRMFVRWLNSKLNLPVFVLVDADAHGLDIFIQYKYGSRSSAHCNERMTVVSAKWLGIWPSEIRDLHINQESLVSLSVTDIAKIDEILTRPYMAGHVEWAEELHCLKRLGVKAEIQALSSISCSFLASNYIPRKINNCLFK